MVVGLVGGLNRLVVVAKANACTFPRDPFARAMNETLLITSNMCIILRPNLSVTGIARVQLRNRGVNTT